jgi:hypothetical protein
MNEEFLHYLWKYRLLDSNLVTVSREPVTILHPGEHNTDGGPDFFNARLKINGTTWAGNVEIHLKSSGWYKHGHQNDPAYDNVILHIVYENDVEVTRRSKEKMPTLIIKDHFPEYIYQRYRDFLENLNWVPCQAVIGQIDPFTIVQWIPGLVVEKIEEKIVLLKKSLEASKFDWEETFYRNLARSFGFRINAHPFELLAQSLPLKLLQKHNDNLLQIEALLFGQAGMLEKDFSEEYPRLLQQEYRFLKEKYSLKGISVGTWKFLRLRPSNFPTLRIAQFASLIHSAKDLFLAVLESTGPQEMIDLLTVSASCYWDNHFMFGKVSVPKPKLLGNASIRLLTINMVAPFLFLYSDVKALPTYKEKGLTFLELLPPESNTVISGWTEIGVYPTDALQTQALLHLKANYCDKKRCLDCRIGNQLLNRGIDV